MREVDTIIIGAGITGLSTAMPLYKAGKEFIILEKEPRVGGQIKTKQQQGFTYETGPNTGTISHPEVIDLFNFASSCQLEIAKETAKGRWIFKGEKFYPLPSGLASAISTPLFTLKDKFRVLLEPFRKKGTDKNESVGALAERRLGKSFVDYAVDPFVGGIYAANPYNLTTRFALPKLYALEQDAGSFILGAIKKKRQGKSEEEKKATKEVFSAKGGLENLVKALADKYNSRNAIALNIHNIKIEYKGENDFVVTFSDKNDNIEAVRCHNIISCTPAFELPSFLNLEGITNYLPDITNLIYAPMIEVLIGFHDFGGIDLNAFGGLVPSKEQRDVLGILFPSSCFDARATGDNPVLLTVFMGGMRDGKRLFPLSDEEIKAKALNEVSKMLKVDLSECSPSFVEVNRHERAIPQYDASMQKRLEVIQSIESSYKGLHIMGNVRDGIGLSHRISQGVNIGRLVASH